jgi:hypothetical protein
VHQNTDRHFIETHRFHFGPRAVFPPLLIFTQTILLRAAVPSMQGGACWPSFDRITMPGWLLCGYELLTL